VITRWYICEKKYHRCNRSTPSCQNTEGRGRLQAAMKSDLKCSNT